MAQLDLLPPLSRAVHSYLVGDELLLFSERAGVMFRLNASAAIIWSCLEEGLDHTAVIGELIQTFNIPAAQAEQDLDTALGQWESQGLIGGQGALSSPISGEPQQPTSSTRIPRPSSIATQYREERHYRMLETVIRVRFSEPGLAHIAESTFGHLRVSGHQAFHLAIDVQQDTQGYFLFFNGELSEYCTSEQEVAPLLHGTVVSEAYARAECLIALHAAAVSNGKACVVFPACSGSGKSTLTAALIASGFQYCTDELVLLKRHTHTAQAIPAGIGTKAGSWPVLAGYHPELEALPVGLRQDGQRVRYLLPSRQVLPGDMAQCHPVKALVFPSYQPEQDATLARISPADALCRLTEAGCDIEGGLDRESVAELVDWIGGLSCYELHYSDLQGAVYRVNELLA